VISELDPDLEPAEAMHLPKAPKETKTVVPEPPIRKATPVYSTAKKSLPYSPGVKKYHSTPAPLPVRRAIPLQRFNQENKPNG
jgi:hypothetical protein